MATSDRRSDGRIARVFLGWDRPAFESVADYLDERHAQESLWDLSQVVLVVPGGRAGRRLGERLAARADEQQRVFFPPHVTTVGQLPELLYRRRQPFASNLTQQLAWTESLRCTSTVVLGEFLRIVPATTEDPRWWELGTLLWRQHRELAADGLDFGQVATAGRKLKGFAEMSRWQALACVQQDYLQRLDKLQLWDRQTARLYAIKHGECQIDRDVMLVGTVDLNQSLRQMLDQVRPQVTALVYADASQRDAFDDYGCLAPSNWRDVEIPLADDQIRAVERPADQAAEVVRFLAELEGRYSASQITVGVPDESLIPLVQRQLAQARVPARYGPGRRWQGSRPARLIRALLRYSKTRDMADLVDLLRHPDLLDWLLRDLPDALSDIAWLDEYCAQRLITTSDQAVWGDDSASQAARRLCGRVNQLLAPLQGPPRLPALWVPTILELLVELYGSCTLSTESADDRLVLGGCETLRDGLLELQHVPSELSRPVWADQAVLMAMSVEAGRQIASPGLPDAVELLGWLELPLDDAPVLVVTQLNEGTVPTSVNADLFLPDALRAHLGLDDNARRYARDAYALTVLARTREQLAVIVGRRDEQGNPLLPSRLIFATDAPRRRKRCLQLFGDGPAERLGTPGGSAMSSTSCLLGGRAPNGAHDPERSLRFSVPRPRPVPPIQRISITDFGAYMRCPYRFYLSRVLKLQSVVRNAFEMDSLAFGSLLHEVLSGFGDSPARDSGDPKEIETWLLEILEQECVRRFGTAPRPAVQIQQEQMRRRLKAFAVHQAQWRNTGWRIVMTEAQGETIGAAWQVDGESIELRGRVDRIDQHETGTYAILDYKSSEQGEAPSATHHPGTGRRSPEVDDWRDLQLPLYRHLATALGLTGEPKLGYITLPRAHTDAGFKLANWSAQDLCSADEAARRIVRAVRAGAFWEPKHFEAGFDAGLDRICQIRVFDRLLEEPPTSGGQYVGGVDG
jgi:ATP-dependent helicase/nuclease subunit B